jgi:hypothetical protein
MRQPMQAWSGFSPTRDEPILPNGTFAGVVINVQNSSDRGMESVIVNQRSYGLQLGKILDALAELAKERADAGKTGKLFNEITRLYEQIEEIKDRTAEGRLRQLIQDLERLGQSDTRNARTLVARLRALIERIDVGED